jgi:hypothetical protein
MFPKHTASTALPDASDHSFRGTTGGGAGGLRDRGELKRNVPTAPTSACTSVSWSCGSAPRDRSSHMDPEVRAQNLKALLANTPFERAKAQRQRQGAFIALMEEEERFRARIVAVSKAAYGVLGGQMAAGNDQADFATVALDTMEGLMRQEYAARLRLITFHRFKVPFLSLCTDEHVERCGLVATEDKRFRETLRLHLWYCDVVEMSDKESTNRCTVLESEGRCRAALWKSYQQHFCCVESAQDEVRSLLQHCSAGREEIAEDEATHRSRVAESLTMCSRRMEACMAERYRLYAEAERVFRMLLREHASHTSLAKEEFADSLERWAELKEQHERDIISLGAMEGSSRDAQECLELEDRAIIASEVSRSTRDLHVAMEMKAVERQRFVRDAIAALTRLGIDLLEEHRVVAAAEEVERSARHEWVSYRHSEQRSTMELAFSQLHFLFDDFTRELMVMWDAMHRQADDVVAWIEEKQQSREAFVLEVYHEHGRGLFAEQLDARRRLYDQMLDEEEELFQWLDIRDEERNVVCGHEMDCRRALDRFEDTARSKLYSIWDGLQQEAQRRLEMFWSSVESIETASYEASQNMWYEESAAWDLLLQRAEQSQLLSFDRQQFREIVELERIESHDRRVVDLDAMRATELVVLQHAHECRELARLQHEALLDACNAIEAEEVESRSYFADTCRTQWDILLLDAVKDKEISQENEATRVREERYRMNEYYQEDARLYDPDEDPLEESKMNMLEFRRSVHADLMLDASNGRKSCSGVPIAKWSEADSRREFLSQALRGFNTSRLPADVVDLLVGVVSDINDSRSVEETQINSLYREVDRVQRETARSHATIVQDREKCRAHEERNKRAEMDNKVHRQQHKEWMAKQNTAIHRDGEQLQRIMQQHCEMDKRITQAKDEKKLKCGLNAASSRSAATVKSQFHHTAAGVGNGIPGSNRQHH